MRVPSRSMARALKGPGEGTRRGAGRGSATQYFRVDEVWRRLAAPGGDEVGGGQRRHRRAGLDGGAADMRQEDDVAQAHERGVDLGFAFVHVKASPGDPSLGQRLSQRRLVDNGTPGRVDEVGGGLHLAQGGAVDQVAGLASEGDMDADEIAL